MFLYMIQFFLCDIKRNVICAKINYYRNITFHECHAYFHSMAHWFVSVELCSQVDLLFILDTSGSILRIDNDNWKHMLTFTKVFVDDLTISPNAARVGVVLLGNNGVLKIKLNGHSDADSLKTAIDNLPFNDQKTNIQGALEEAKRSFTTANGARDNVRNVAIFVTDGEKSHPDFANPQPSATDLKDSGVEVFVITHDYYFKRNESTIKLVETIASAKLTKHLFIIEDFSYMTNYIPPIKETMDSNCVAPTAYPHMTSSTKASSTSSMFKKYHQIDLLNYCQ